MNTAIFWRLVWKEYCQQRALWTAIAFAGLIFQAAVLIYCSLNGVHDLPDKLFTVALSVPILYSLGCGAALFAGEHEAETFPFQQALPVSGGRVFLAKFAFGTVSALLLFPVLWLLAFAMASWQLPDARWHLRLWGGGVVATVEVLIWAALGSLVLRRVLPAAVVSGVLAVLLGYSSLVLVMVFGSHLQLDADEYFSTLPIRTCFALVALAIASRFGSQWFSERPIRWSWTATQRVRSNAATPLLAAPATGLTVMTRLVWHEWRQGRTTLLWCLFGYFVVATWLAIAEGGGMSYLGLLPVLATIFGASVFAGDQRQSQYQFFTEHGVRPRLVWLSRQCVWGSVLAIVAAAALLQLWGSSSGAYAQNGISSFLGIAVLVFASSQLCSIMIRSGIVAVFTAGLVSVVLGLWIGLMLRMGVPWQLCALPLPFIFFWASWLFALKWIQQRPTWRVRIVTAATIIAPLLCVVAATATFRVYEIPAVELTFESTVLPSDSSPAARETAAMYEKADRLLRGHSYSDGPDTTTSTRDSERQVNFELFLAASQRKACRFDRWGEQLPGSIFDGNQLTHNVIEEAKDRTESGDLEGAAELHIGLLRLASHFYQQRSEVPHRRNGMAVESGLYSILPTWADHESQTPERIHEALTQLQTWSKGNAPDWEGSLLENRDLVREFIALDDRVFKNHGMQARERFGIKTLGILLPWERWRMSRLIDVYTAAELQGIREIRARGPRIPPHAQSTAPWDVRLTSSGKTPKLIRSLEVETWLSTTRWPGLNARLIAPELVSWMQQYEVARSAVQLQLALISWRKQHGELPDDLQQLLDDTFESLPLDPYTKDPFVYFPNGVNEEVWDDDAMGMGSMDAMGMGGAMMPMFGEGMAPVKPRLVRSEPFLWSPGALLSYAPGVRRGRSGTPIASDFRDQQGNALSEQDLLHKGVRYPIPQAKQQPSDSSDAADALPNDE